MAATAADVSEEAGLAPVVESTGGSTPGGLAFWVAHLAFWSVAFAVILLFIRVFRPAVADPHGYILAHVALCVAATATMRWLSFREPLLRRLDVSKTGLIAGGGILSAVLITLAMVASAGWFGVAFPSRPELVARFAITSTMLATWCAFYFGWQLIRERRSAEIRAIEAESLALRNELRHLQGQISPHFLFNALNTVKACRDDPEAIATLTQSLAGYLRHLLRPTTALEPLGRELDALEEYLTIQGMRFGDGLETRIDCDYDVRGVLVPPVMVQPLVENAIKYGGQTAPRPVRVHVGVRRDGAWLALEVANAGNWVPPGGAESPGTGLGSLERRLQLLVGPASTVTHREESGWVRVLVRVPLPRPGQDDAEEER